MHRVEMNNYLTVRILCRSMKQCPKLYCPFNAVSGVKERRADNMVHKVSELTTRGTIQIGICSS